MSQKNENEIEEETSYSAQVPQNGNGYEEQDPWLKSNWMPRPKVGVPTTIRFPKVCNMQTFKPDKKRMDKNNPDKLTDVRIVMVTTPEEPDIEREYTITSKRLFRQISDRINKEGYTELTITAQGQGRDRTYTVDPSRNELMNRARQELQKQQRLPTTQTA